MSRLGMPVLETGQMAGSIPAYPTILFNIVKR